MPIIFNYEKNIGNKSRKYIRSGCKIVPGSCCLPPWSTKNVRLVWWNGFPGSINFLTQGAGLPWIIGFLVIIIEFFAPLFLVPGFLTRIAAFAIGVEFTGVVLKAHINNGFFMNWYKQPNKGEGLEFFILLFGLVIIALILGGGKASIDAAISQRTKD